MTDKRKLVFNYDKLRGLLREVGMTQDELASRISLSPTSLSHKLNGKIMFSPEEMLNIQKVLEITDQNFKLYFFTLSVRKIENKQTA